MSNSFVEDGTFVNSIVGEGTRLNGELDLNGLLRIDGDFSGTIRTNGKVLIGKNGRAKCTITASTVVVGGALRGNIYSSEKVIILSSGIIFGNIFTPRLIVEEGVILDGTCTIKSNYAENIDHLKESAKEAVKEPENTSYSNSSGTTPAPAATSDSSQYSSVSTPITNQLKNDYTSSSAAQYSTHYEKESEEKALRENITKGPLL